ncbi:MAG: family 10 glycosylhydrolase [Planctomycetota bacterium]|nr:family 10 glycosylhydrolase [Planctomycetota bacterium]
MKRIFILLFAGVVFSQSAPAMGAEKTVVLDECNYSSAEAARSQWRPTENDTPAVEVATVEERSVLKLPCNFHANKHWELIWQRNGEWNLSACREIAMTITAQGDQPAMMMLYFRSGAGWYWYSWLHVPAGTSTVTLPRDMFGTCEGEPGGWDKVTAVRIGIVREDSFDRTILVSDIQGLVGKGGDPLTDALSRLGKAAGYNGVRELTAATRSNLIGREKDRRDAVLKMLTEAEDITRRAGATMKRGDSAKAVELLAEAQRAYIQAYAASVPSKPGEFRAVWCHNPNGPPGMTRNWDKALKMLSDLGFNAIIVNMSWGGTAAYKSKLLPMAEGAKGRDLLAECVAAGGKHGIAVHAWKCNMRCKSDKSGKFYKDLLAAGRFQTDWDGKTVNYALCPSDPANRKLEVDSMVEMARDYDVAGIHFDYIRYPGIDTCYCDRCRKRFEAEYKVKVKNWPADVRTGPLMLKYQQFRRDRITDIVADVGRDARKARPNVLISAAVYWHWPSARIRVGQDWKLWVEKGYLDFICPMQYTSSATDFEGWTQRTSRWVGGRIPLMPGIGLVRLMRPEQTLHNVLITRKYNTAGFVLFQYRPPPVKEHLPLLHLGATSEKTEWTAPKSKTDK